MIELESTNKSYAITGNNNISKYFLSYLKNSFAKAHSVDIIVSFLMESGVKLILRDLKEAINRGVKIRILTGDYLNITQPSALYLLRMELGNKIEIKFFNDKSRSFHPKAYIFHNDYNDEIYIGSSNISKSALTSGVEWNYRFTSDQDQENYREFYNTFLNLYENHSILIDDNILKNYSKHWIKPVFNKNTLALKTKGVSNKENIEEMTYIKEENNSYNVVNLFEPRGAQIEALYSLENAKEEGANKSLIVCATGFGKTYTAAFFSKPYKKILFVSHREEILNQSAIAFKNVRNSDDIGFLTGKIKDINHNMVFASVATLGQKKYLNKEYFNFDEFSLIIYDEIHHGVGKQYQNIINYFKPEFMLGLTATPERLDGRDIYTLFDYIVPYEIDLKTSINKGMLVPFRYYGIYDETINYDNIEIIGSKYNFEQLQKQLIINKRSEVVYKHYKKYRNKRCLGFCYSKLHAIEMTKFFISKGVKAVAVYSGENNLKNISMNRKEAIQKLKTGEIEVIFSVDMFNEGVDIKNIDMVMLLRPTESPTVYMQQIGRGLRIADGKEYVNILDFIGNYKKASMAPFILAGKKYNSKDVINENVLNYDYPEKCRVDFDFKLIDLFDEIAKKQITKKQIIKTEFYKIKEEVGDIPTRMDLFKKMSEDVYNLCRKSSKENPFNNYIEYLYELDELNEDEKLLYNSIGREFINLLEKTSMSKSYKIPILNAFYNKGDIKLNIEEEDIYKSYKEFYNCGYNYKDLLTAKKNKDFLSWDKKRYIYEAKKNPIKFLIKSGKGFFLENQNYIISINKELEKVIQLKSFKEHMKDVIDYRTVSYYKNRWESNK